MELRDYVAIVRRYQIMLWTIVVISTLAVGIYTSRQPWRHEGSVVLYVTQSTTQPNSTSTYQYDNYYALSSAGLYADQVKTFFSDPGFVSKVFARANEGLPDVSSTQIAQIFIAKSFDPASAVEVTFDDSDATRVTNVLNAAADEVTQETQSLQTAGAARSITVTHNAPYVHGYQSSVLLMSVIAALVSACASLALIFLIEFGRPRK